MNRLLGGFCGLALLLGGGFRASAALTDGLAVYYSFDPPPVGGVLADESGNGHDGTVHGSPQQTAGIVHGAYEFNGTQDFIETPSFLASAPAFTVSSWVKVLSFTDASYMMAFNQAPAVFPPPISPGYFNFALGSPSDPGGFGISGYWSDATPFDMRTAFMPAPVSIPSGVWKHLVVTYDGTVMRQYIDGALLNENQQRPDLTLSYDGKTLGNGEPFLIGKGYAYPGSLMTTFLHGQLDEFRVYDRALTPSEIAQLARTPQSVYVTHVGFSNSPFGEQSLTQFSQNETLYMTVRHKGLANLANPLVQAKLTPVNGPKRVLLTLVAQPDGSYTGSVPMDRFNVGDVDVDILGFPDDTSTETIFHHRSNIHVLSSDPSGPPKSDAHVVFLGLEKVGSVPGNNWVKVLSYSPPNVSGSSRALNLGYGWISEDGRSFTADRTRPSRTVFYGLQKFDPVPSNNWETVVSYSQPNVSRERALTLNKGWIEVSNMRLVFVRDPSEPSQRVWYGLHQFHDVPLNLWETVVSYSPPNVLPSGALDIGFGWIDVEGDALRLKFVRDLAQPSRDVGYGLHKFDPIPGNNAVFVPFYGHESGPSIDLKRGWIDIIQEQLSFLPDKSFPKSNVFRGVVNFTGVPGLDNVVLSYTQSGLTRPVLIGQGWIRTIGQNMHFDQRDP